MREPNQPISFCVNTLLSLHCDLPDLLPQVLVAFANTFCFAIPFCLVSIGLFGSFHFLWNCQFSWCRFIRKGQVLLVALYLYILL